MVAPRTKAAKARQKPKRQRNKAADERYNERRRARRAAERLEKQAKLQSGSVRKETLKQASKLREAINNSYVNKKTRAYKNAIGQLDNLTKSGREFSRKVAQQIKSFTYEENQRRTKMQINYFRSAARTKAQIENDEDLTPQQKLARAEQSFFYSSTRVFWGAGSANLRNENILEAFENARLESGRRVENLQDAVQFIKEQYPDEYPTMERALRGEYDTEDKMFQGEQEEESTSPPPISRSQLARIVASTSG